MSYCTQELIVICVYIYMLFVLGKMCKIKIFFNILYNSLNSSGQFGLGPDDAWCLEKKKEFV